jgi:AAA+ ATPase superfamily predicted ATPase
MTNSLGFFNRKAERAELRRLLASPKSELIIVYGRRGVGKSSLLEDVLKHSGLPYVFFRATRRTLTIQMEELASIVADAFPDAFLSQPFSSFSIFLEFLTHRASAQEKAGGPPVVVVVDELSYIADVDPGLLTVLQHWWDANKRRPNIKIFLAGSYVSFMESQVLNSSSPLYNRRTGAMKLEPIDYADAALFFPNYTDIDKMTAYSILGGLPSYLEQFDPNLTIEQNVKATILRRNTYLSEEPEWLLLEDLRRDTVAGSILRVIAKGERRPSDIARAIGKKSAQDISSSLETLRGLGLVLREVPITEIYRSRSRNSLYWIADAYLDFWYRFVDPSQSLVARGLGERLWDEAIAPALPHHISRPTFERACRQYLWRSLSNQTLPPGLSFTDVGTWWGAGDREIDVVAKDSENQVVLLGSCKWTNAPMDVAEYATLLADTAAASADLQSDQTKFNTGEGPWYALFSRSGFTDRLKDLAKYQSPSRLLLVSLNDMYST